MEHRDIPLDRMPDILCRVLDYWRSKGGERLICSWNDFELIDLPAELLPTVLVIDVHPDMDENRYRYWGSRMSVVHGRDMTGLCPYDIDPPGMGELLRRLHAIMMAEKGAKAARFQFVRASGAVHHHYSLKLPLSDDGERVTQIVAVIDMSEDESADLRNGY